ncbi:hypothetical protein B0H13DRAFT_1918252 [Mycena leptocephala]|nr:hypothetical protein B0H13DRAFT_1918252 [Mycena leptocephala]
MPQLVIRRPDGPQSAISRNAHILQELCLPLETLDTLGFTPDEPWSEFFEFRLRPMVYLVHAGVTQDFSLIGRKGVYSLGELEEIRHWVHQALLHCRLLLVCRKALQPVYKDDFSISGPPTWGIPGEAVAMFEIMYRICLSIGFPCSDDSLCLLDRHVLLPLIMGARETRALFKTADDYSAYNRFGEVVDADRNVEGPRLLTPKARVRGKSIGRKPEVTARTAFWGMCEREVATSPKILVRMHCAHAFLVFLVITSLHSLVLVYCSCSAAEIPLVVNLAWIFSSIIPKQAAPTARRPGDHLHFVESGAPSRKKPSPTPSVHESSGAKPKNARSTPWMSMRRSLLPSQKGSSFKQQGLSVSNAAESSSKPAEVLLRSCPPEAAPRSKTQVVDLETIEIEEKLQINDSFDFDVRRTSRTGSRGCTNSTPKMRKKSAKNTRGWRRGTLMASSNGGVLLARRPRRALDALPSDPEILSSSTPAPATLLEAMRGTITSRRGRNMTRPSRKGDGILGEAEGEVFGVERARTRVSRQDSTVHQYQSSRVLTYIEERKRAVAEFEMRLNMLGCYILFCVRAQFEGEDRVLDRGFPLPTPAQAPRRLPVRVAAVPPPLPAPVPRARGKAMSAEPDIAVLEQGSNSGSDDAPLSVQRKSKGKKKAVAASRESRGKSRAGSEGKDKVDPEIITRTVKVKKGKRQSAVELTGPRNEYDSQLWHDRNDLFVIDAPTTSTGGNKIVTHAYPYNENHPRFSGTWKRRIALSSLPARTGCVRCLLADNECVRPRYGDETPTAACTHCRTDNTTCELSPVEFDWEMTGAALPDVNAEWMELQLSLMLEIADEVGGVGTTERLLARFMRHLRSLGTDRDVLEARRAIFGSENSSVAGGKSGHRARSSSRGGEDSETNDSGTEVEGGKGGKDGDVSMGNDKGSADDEPPLTASASASGRSSPPSAPSVRLTMESVEIPAPTLLSPPVIVSPALSLSTSIFGKAGVLLGSKPNETSEGFVANSEVLEEGEIDAEGEIVVGTSTGETSGAGVNVNMD